MFSAGLTVSIHAWNVTWTIWYPLFFLDRNTYLYFTAGQWLVDQWHVLFSLLLICGTIMYFPSLVHFQDSFSTLSHLWPLLFIDLCGVNTVRFHSCVPSSTWSFHFSDALKDYVEPSCIEALRIHSSMFSFQCVKVSLLILAHDHLWFIVFQLFIHMCMMKA